MQRLGKSIKNADILGFKISLLTNSGEKKSKSYFGGVISILMGLLMVAGSTVFFMDFVNRKNYTLISNEIDDPDVVIKDFKRIPLMLRLSGDGQKRIQNDFYRVTLQLTTFNVSVSASSMYEDVIMETCNLETHFKGSKYYEMFKEIKEFDSYVCPSWVDHEFDLYGVFGSTMYTLLKIQFYPCSESLCNQQEVDKALATSYLDFITLTNSLNHNDHVPNKERLIKNRIAVSSTIFKRIRFYFDSISYLTDTGYIFSNIEDRRINIFSVTYDVEMDLRDVKGKEFLRVLVHNTPATTTYIKSYMKAQTMLANIGGIIKGLAILGKIICYSISKNLMDQELLNCVYDKSTSFTVNELTKETTLDFHQHNKNKNKVKINENSESLNNMFQNNTKSINNKAIIKPKLSLLNNLVKNTTNYENTSNNSNNLPSKEFEFIKNKFEFSYLNLLDPCQLCLSNNLKSVYQVRISKLKDLMKIDNVLSNFQEHTAIKSLIFDEHQIKILENIHKLNPDTSQLSKSINEVSKNRENVINKKIMLFTEV